MEPDLTTLLHAAGGGDAKALDELFHLVYRELRSIARAHRRRWVGNETLNTTALIHEAYIKLAGRDSWEDRAHFYATAAKAMRQILINYAERSRAAKRGSGEVVLDLDDVVVASDEAAEDLLALNQALERLEREKPRWCRVVECRFFAGLTVEETAHALGVSRATANREWRLAAAWLYQALHADAPEESA